VRKKNLSNKPQVSSNEERFNHVLAKHRQVRTIKSYTTLADTLRLFNNAEHSDATIRIYDKILPIHKAIICTQSAYFRNAFRAEFVEGSTGLLTFNDGSGAAHWRVFEYLYTGNYPDDLANDFEGKEVLSTHVFGSLTATRRPCATEGPSGIRPC
jgi:hypothetical protein